MTEELNPKCHGCFGFPLKDESCKTCSDKSDCKKNSNYVFATRIVSLTPKILKILCGGINLWNSARTTEVTIPLKEIDKYTQLLCYAGTLLQKLVFLLDQNGYLKHFRKQCDWQTETGIF